MRKLGILFLLLISCLSLRNVEAYCTHHRNSHCNADDQACDQGCSAALSPGMILCYYGNAGTMAASQGYVAIVQGNCNAIGGGAWKHYKIQLAGGGGGGGGGDVTIGDTNVNVEMNWDQLEQILQSVFSSTEVKIEDLEGQVGQAVLDALNQG